VSWSLVRTCRRCGERAEKEITTPEGADRAALVLKHHFEQPDSDDGCPSCDPVLAERCEAVGIEVLGYLAAVKRARKPPPS
jgi:hypothetical protein